MIILLSIVGKLISDKAKSISNFHFFFLLCWMVFSCNSAEKEQKILELEAKVKGLKESNHQLAVKNAELESQIFNLESQLDGSPKIYSNEDFWTFFWKFMTDTSFQVTRITFPLEYITWKELPNGDIDLGGEIVTVHIPKKEWNHDYLYASTANERTQVYDNFKLKFQPTNERVLHWFGIETGGDAKYFFKAFKSKWYLVKKEQLGD